MTVISLCSIRSFSERGGDDLLVNDPPPSTASGKDGPGTHSPESQIHRVCPAKMKK